MENFSPHLLVSDGKDERRNWSIEQAQVQNQERRPRGWRKVEKLVDKTGDTEGCPGAENQSEGDDVDLGSSLLFSPHWLTRVQVPVAKGFLDNNRTCRKGIFPLVFYS